MQNIILGLVSVLGIFFMFEITRMLFTKEVKKIWYYSILCVGGVYFSTLTSVILLNKLFDFTRFDSESLSMDWTPLTKLIQIVYVFCVYRICIAFRPLYMRLLK